MQDIVGEAGDLEPSASSSQNRDYSIVHSVHQAADLALGSAPKSKFNADSYGGPSLTNPDNLGVTTTKGSSTSRSVSRQPFVSGDAAGETPGISDLRVLQHSKTSTDESLLAMSEANADAGKSGMAVNIRSPILRAPYMSGRAPMARAASTRELKSSMRGSS